MTHYIVSLFQLILFGIQILLINHYKVLFLKILTDLSFKFPRKCFITHLSYHGVPAMCRLVIVI